MVEAGPSVWVSSPASTTPPEVPLRFRCRSAGMNIRPSALADAAPELIVYAFRPSRRANTDPVCREVICRVSMSDPIARYGASAHQAKRV